MSKSSGFTLVELLVVLAIIGILAAIGLTIFSSTTKSANDSKRKADIESISKAYEGKYPTDGRYLAVTSADFTQGSIPKDPRGNDYYNVVASDGSGFKVCAALEANTTPTCDTISDTCFCRISTISQISSTASLINVGSVIPTGVPTSGPTNAPTSVPATPTPTVSLTNGLIAYWRMDEAANGSCTGGKDVCDSKGTGHGTVTGTTITSSGKISRGRSFSSSQADSIRVLNPAAISGPYTFSAWINPISIATDGRIISKDTNGVGRTELLLQAGPVVSFRLRTAGGGSDLTISAPVQLGVWSYVVGVYNGSQTSIYINGVVVAGPTTFTGTVGTNNYDVYIGNEATGNRGFHGLLDEVGIWNRALSSSEITQLYNNGNGIQP